MSGKLAEQVWQVEVQVEVRLLRPQQRRAQRRLEGRVQLAMEQRHLVVSGGEA